MLGMNKEVTTDPLTADDLRLDLRQNIDWLRQSGITEVLLFFGYSWGNAIYEGQWEDIPTAVTAVQTMVTDAENKAFGYLGNDNLYITVPELKAKLLYGYETDIHLSYADKNDFVEAVVNRWKESGWLLYGSKGRA